MRLERWERAQQYERRFWENVAESAAVGSLWGIDFYEWRAGDLQRRLKRLGFEHLTGGGACVVEIGGGPVGIIAHFPAAQREAVDPLEPFYRTVSTFVPFRSNEVTYREGVGERLPYETSNFDLAIVDNCIDHVKDVDAVLREVLRVLRPGGVLYLTVNARSRWGYGVHRVLSRLLIDPGHPHSFTPLRIHRRLRKHGFRVEAMEVGSLRKPGSTT